MPTPRRAECLATAVGLVDELADVCASLRKEAGAREDDISYHLPLQRGRDPRTIRAFEEGRPPKRLDDVVQAYASELGVPAVLIYRRALEQLETKVAEQVSELSRQARAENNRVRQTAPSRRTLAAKTKPPSRAPRRQRQ